MEILTNIFIFLFSAAVIWFFAGMIIESVDRVAKRFHKTGFTIAFFILGFLTSISEFSVAFNATIDGVPDVSAGNLIGASLVILLFIMPILAVSGDGIEIKHTLHNRNLLLALGVIILPVLIVIDGDVTVGEGILALMVYVTLLFAIRGQKDTFKEVKVIEESLLEPPQAKWIDGGKILFGGVFIFLAGHFLVEQSVFFAGVLNVPGSLIGLLLLSLGTNVPELVVAFRAIIKKHKDIAFGDYIGSAATNTVLFGFLAILNGRFQVEASEFTLAAVFMTVGFLFFYFFAQSRRKISKKEGLILLAFYGAFLLSQVINFAAVR